MPSDAECAATALATAAAATVTTYSRDPSSRTLQTVTRLAAQPDARIAFWLEPQSWAVANLLARPLATVTVADPRSTSAVVMVRGGVRRASGSRSPHGVQEAPPGTVPFLLEVTSVRLRDAGRPGADVLVDAESFRRAEPDPLLAEAPGVLIHLRRAHGADLLHCLTTQGHPDAEWVEPRRLDRYGLEVLVVTAESVAEVRLPFPGSLTSLAQLGPGLRSALTCRCEPPDAGIA
jgi:hypothetical protein